MSHFFFGYHKCTGLWAEAATPYHRALGRYRIEWTASWLFDETVSVLLPQGQEITLHIPVLRDLRTERTFGWAFVFSAVRLYDLAKRVFRSPGVQMDCQGDLGALYRVDPCRVWAAATRRAIEIQSELEEILLWPNRVEVVPPTPLLGPPRCRNNLGIWFSGCFYQLLQREGFHAG